MHHSVVLGLTNRDKQHININNHSSKWDLMGCCTNKTVGNGENQCMHALLASFPKEGWQLSGIHSFMNLFILRNHSCQFVSLSLLIIYIYAKLGKWGAVSFVLLEGWKRNKIKPFLLWLKLVNYLSYFITRKYKKIFLIFIKHVIGSIDSPVLIESMSDLISVSA